MKKLAPGLYADGDGGLHVDLPEFNKHCGWPDTPENRKKAVAVCQEAAQLEGIPFQLVN